MRLILASIAVALLAAPAIAAERRDDAALAHLDVGVAAYRAGDYVAARREFEAARRLVPDKANPYRWLGLTAVQLGDCTQALLDFEMFLKLVPPGDERVPEVTRLRDQCERPPAAPGAPTTTPMTTPVPTTAPAPSPPRGLFVATTPTRPAPSKRLVRRWWFWTALGGAAALAAAGITLGVVLGTPRETPLPPIVCGTTGCAPAGTM